MSDRFKKLILAVGVLILCIIWGRNFILIGDASQAVINNEASESLVTKEVHANASRGFTFQRVGRDPFEIPVNRKQTIRSAMPSPSTTPEAIPGPKAAYRGVVWNKRRAQVVLFDSLKNTTRILEQGDTINNFVLSSISRDKIVLKNGRYRTIWNRAQDTE